jgi:hypothetical protein
LLFALEVLAPPEWVCREYDNASGDTENT